MATVKNNTSSDAIEIKPSSFFVNQFLPMVRFFVTIDKKLVEIPMSELKDAKIEVVE